MQLHTDGSRGHLLPIFVNHDDLLDDDLSYYYYYCTMIAFYGASSSWVIISGDHVL